MEKVAGTYLNKFGDTLTLTYDSTSIYNNRFIIREQLTSGATRENKGRWFYDSKKKQISFSTVTDSRIEYRHTVQKERAEGQSVVKIYYADSDNLVPVYGLLPSKNGEQMGIMGKFHGDMDYVTFDSKEYDKLQFQISYFKDFILDIPDSVNYTYTVRFYPEEHLYLLDNNSYKAKGSSIEPKIEADGKDRYRFKKNEVQHNL